MAKIKFDEIIREYNFNTYVDSPKIVTYVKNSGGKKITIEKRPSCMTGKAEWNLKIGDIYYMMGVSKAVVTQEVREQLGIN